MRFTDSYGEQSCTAGRAAFISGQSVYRTGMSKVGIPGADVGWAAEDPDDPKSGAIGKQVIEDTGALDTKRTETFKEFPPRHEPASFTIDHAVKARQKFLAKD
jgi:hypothetical protein